MNAESDDVQARLRDHLPLAPSRETGFRWRGAQVTRMEGFTDTVFGFAVTLLVVALEVPRSYEGLLDVLRGFPAFVICFMLLMLFWNEHYRFHRRYGLVDAFSRVMTMAILVLVLFVVYPLKFLFTMLTASLLGLDMADAPRLQGAEQIRYLYVIYGLGFAGTWGLFAALYVHAWRKRDELELNAVERIHTRASLGETTIYVAICLLSILLALTTSSSWLPGVVYFLLGPLQAANGWWHGRRIAALTSREPASQPAPA
jgi:uncharacterized membrane protein